MSEVPLYRFQASDFEVSDLECRVWGRILGLIREPLVGKMHLRQVMRLSIQVLRLGV